MSAMDKLVAGMEANYQEARAKAKSFGGEKIPAGRYEGRLISVKLYEKPDGSQISLVLNYVVTTGANKGMSHQEYLNLFHPVGLSIALQAIELLGYDAPESPAGLPPIVEEIIEEGAEYDVIFEMIVSGDWHNARLLEVLDEVESDEDDDEDVEEGSSEEEEEEEEDDDQEEDSDDEDSDSEEEEEAEEPAPKKKPSPVKKEAKKEEEASEVPQKKLTKKLLIKWAETQGIEDLNENWTIDKLKEELKEYEIEESELEEEELEFLEAYGIKDILKK